MTLPSKELHPHCKSVLAAVMCKMASHPDHLEKDYRDAFWWCVTAGYLESAGYRITDKGRKAYEDSQSD